MKMTISVYVFLVAIACSAVAFPKENPFNSPDQFDLTKLVFKNAYAEPINPVKTVDLPGSRIVGGVELAPHSAPYQAALFVNGGYLCSGSLITTTRILTTAFCINGGSYVEVRLGAHRYNEEEDTQVRVTSTSIMIHDSYDNDGRRANDIAIIFLPTQVTLNDYIKVVALAPATAGTYEDTWGLLSGWGITTDSTELRAPALRGVYVNIMSNLDCRSFYGESVVLDSIMCTSGTGIVGVCDSDQGDPLVVNGVLVGLVAFSGYRCEIGMPSGYTRVSSYRPWIDTYADL